MVGRSAAARVPAAAGPRHRVHRPPARQHALHGYCTHHPRSVWWPVHRYCVFLAKKKTDVLWFFFLNKESSYILLIWFGDVTWCMSTKFNLFLLILKWTLFWQSVIVKLICRCKKCDIKVYLQKSYHWIPLSFFFRFW